MVLVRSIYLKCSCLILAHILIPLWFIRGYLGEGGRGVGCWLTAESFEQVTPTEIGNWPSLYLPPFVTHPIRRKKPPKKRITSSRWYVCQKGSSKAGPPASLKPLCLTSSASSVTKTLWNISRGYSDDKRGYLWEAGERKHGWNMCWEIRELFFQ